MLMYVFYILCFQILVMESSLYLANPPMHGTISPAELKKLRRCGSFDLSGPIIYKRLWFNSNKQPRALKFVFRLPHSRCDFLEPLWFPCGDLRTENIRRHCSPPMHCLSLRFLRIFSVSPVRFFYILFL
jgi:hypothetical protein